MNEKPLKIAVIVGEASGEKLAYELLSAYKREYDDDIMLYGVGGELLEKLGMRRVFHYKEISIIGFVAVIAKFFYLLKLINLCTIKIDKFSPDILLIVDAPDFSHRVAKKIKKENPNIKIVNYVPPSVWVWREKRARKMTRYIDLVLSIFPFEVEVMRKLGGPKTIYCGHPLFNREVISDKKTLEFKRKYGLLNNNKIILFLPGSRRSALFNSLDIICDMAQIIKNKYSEARFIIPCMSEYMDDLGCNTSLDELGFLLIHDDDEKRISYELGDVALVSPGTVALELVMSKTPMVAGKRISTIDYFVLKHLSKIDSYLLPNIIAKKMFINEFYQDAYKADDIAAEMLKLLDDDKARDMQLCEFDKIAKIMEIRGKIVYEPAKYAAGILNEVIHE